VRDDGAQPHTMGFLCGADGPSLAATASAELIVAGAVEEDYRHADTRRPRASVFAPPTPSWGGVFVLSSRISVCWTRETQISSLPKQRPLGTVA
jgi:hypothetical protein